MDWLALTKDWVAILKLVAVLLALVGFFWALFSGRFSFIEKAKKRPPSD
jgi:nitrogen fixation-related uncharacterized protein